MDKWRQAVIWASGAPLFCVSHLVESHICAQSSLSPVTIAAIMFSVAFLDEIIAQAIRFSLMFLIIFLVPEGTSENDSTERGGGHKQRQTRHELHGL